MATGKPEPCREFLIGRVSEKPDITMPDLAADRAVRHGVKARPGSRRTCVRPQPRPTTPCGAPSVTSARTSSQARAGTSSSMPDIRTTKSVMVALKAGCSSEGVLSLAPSIEGNFPPTVYVWPAGRLKPT